MTDSVSKKTAVIVGESPGSKVQWDKALQGGVEILDETAFEKVEERAARPARSGSCERRACVQLDWLPFWRIEKT